MTYDIADRKVLMLAADNIVVFPLDYDDDGLKATYGSLAVPSGHSAVGLCAFGLVVRSGRTGEFGIRTPVDEVPFPVSRTMLNVDDLSMSPKDDIEKYLASKA